MWLCLLHQLFPPPATVLPAVGAHSFQDVDRLVAAKARRLRTLLVTTGRVFFLTIDLDSVSDSLVRAALTSE